jgi:uncharacterized protein (DUF2147 family)
MTNLLRNTLVALWLGSAALLATAQAADEQLARAGGNWLTGPKDGIIQLTVHADGSLEGRIVGGNHPGRKDEHNPDPALRTQALRGQVIVRDMRYQGEGRWSGGTIYDPESGKTYKCNIELDGPDALKVRGYIGFSLLGRSQQWTRYTGASMDLPPAP